ncbi:MAG: hypothetical protein K8R21_10040 [Leptospira sp.]|nr:hypothetical protein [Leptospira sp.]
MHSTLDKINIRPLDFMEYAVRIDDYENSQSGWIGNLNRSSICVIIKGEIKEEAGEMLSGCIIFRKSNEIYSFIGKLTEKEIVLTEDQGREIVSLINIDFVSELRSEELLSLSA